MRLSREALRERISTLMQYGPRGILTESEGIPLVCGEPALWAWRYDVSRDDGHGQCRVARDVCGTDPERLGLDDSTFPEKWLFVVANDSVVIHAQPLGLFHNKFPFEVLELEPDGYAMFKRSMLDIVRPMNDVMNWLVNTHFYNTRKALNDMFVVDPSRVVMKDVLSPEPGKIIRLREEMYGQDVRTAITQFRLAT